MSVCLEDRKRSRELIKRGFVRGSAYLANLARRYGIPVEEGPWPEGSKELGPCYWTPAWFEWHLQRFKNGALAHISQRERLEQAQELLHDKCGQLLLLSEAQLAGGTLEDPTGDLSTEAAIQLLKEELGE